MRWLFGTPAERVGRVSEDDEEAFLHIVCQSFNIDLATARPFFYEDPYYPHNQRWALWIEEERRWRMVSVLTAIPIQMWIGDRAVAGVGIAGVATHPLYRRRGYAGRLLQSVVRELYAQAIPMAVLQAFDHSFYRRFGWETVGTLTRLRIEPSRLTPFSVTGVRRADLGDYEAIMALHQKRMPIKTGMLVRDDLRWNYLLWNFRHKWVYEADGQIEGYLFYDYLDGGWGLRVREFLWQTERARQAFIGWLARNAEGVRYVEFSGLPDELNALGILPISERHAQPEEPLIRYEVLAGFMARPIEPLHLLQSVLEDQPAPDGFVPFGITLQDKVRGASDTFWITESCGRLRVSQEGQAGTRLRVSTEVLAQMVWGALSVREICARRKLAVPESIQEALDSLFPARQPCLRPMDFF